MTIPDGAGSQINRPLGYTEAVPTPNTHDIAPGYAVKRILILKDQPG